jgi:hypothetical protein
MFLVEQIKQVKNTILGLNLGAILYGQGWADFLGKRTNENFVL